LRDPDEEARVDTIAEGLGMRRVGLVFTQAVGRKASETGEYTMSNREVVQAAQLQAEGGIPEWVTAIVKLEVGDDGTGDVHFEAFQMCEICVKLFKDGVLETEVQDADDPRLSKMWKEVVAGGRILWRWIMTSSSCPSRSLITRYFPLLTSLVLWNL
jgi:nuclear protein localization protein 4 homolog